MTQSGKKAAGWRRLFPFLIAILALAIDQFSKYIVFNTMGPGTGKGAILFFDGLIFIQFRANTGASFSILRGQNWFFMIAATIIIVAVTAYILWAAPSSKFLLVALGLTIGGAAGNLIDRFNYGYVVDFLGASFWPTINMADVAIVLGVMLLAAYILFSTPKTAAVSGHARGEN